MLYRGKRLFFNLLVLELCLFSPRKKPKKTKFTGKSTTAHTQRMADVTVSWGLHLTRRVLEKICVHSLKHRHICLDTGPRTYPRINLWNQWSQCSYYENWVEYGASSSRFGPVSSGWVNWHRNICKRTPQNNLQPHGQFRKVAYDSLMWYPVWAVTQGTVWGEGVISLRCTENLITGLGTRKNFLRGEKFTSSLLRMISRPI